MHVFRFSCTTSAGPLAAIVLGLPNFSKNIQILQRTALYRSLFISWSAWLNNTKHTKQSTQFGKDLGLLISSRCSGTSAALPSPVGVKSCALTVLVVFY